MKKQSILAAAAAAATLAMAPASQAQAQVFTLDPIEPPTRCYYIDENGLLAEGYLIDGVCVGSPIFFGPLAAPKIY